MFIGFIHRGKLLVELQNGVRRK